VVGKIAQFTMIGFLILVLVLCGCLFLNLSENKALLNGSITALKDTVATLQNKEGQLEQSKAELAEKENTITQISAQLLKSNSQLEITSSELDQTKTALSQMAAKVNTIEEKISNLQFQSTTEDNNAELDKFFLRYAKPEQEFGVYNLDYFLKHYQWVKNYQADVFDCSEMSACTEWVLENAGFHTIIATGNSPDGNFGKHAWLLVEVEQGKYMPVEATATSPYIVWWDNAFYSNYFKYEHQFETIQDALKYNTAEFDWWNS
jgi:hypothetical protein